MVPSKRASSEGQKRESRRRLGRLASIFAALLATPTMVSAGPEWRVALADIAQDGRAELLAGGGADPAALASVETLAYDGFVLRRLGSFATFTMNYGVNVAAGICGY